MLGRVLLALAAALLLSASGCIDNGGGVVPDDGGEQPKAVETSEAQISLDPSVPVTTAANFSTVASPLGSRPAQQGKVVVPKDGTPVVAFIGDAGNDIRLIGEASASGTEFSPRSTARALARIALGYLRPFDAAEVQKLEATPSYSTLLAQIQQALSEDRPISSVPELPETLRQVLMEFHGISVPASFSPKEIDPNRLLCMPISIIPSQPGTPTPFFPDVCAASLLPSGKGPLEARPLADGIALANGRAIQWDAAGTPELGTTKTTVVKAMKPLALLNVVDPLEPALVTDFHISPGHESFSLRVFESEETRKLNERSFLIRVVRHALGFVPHLEIVAGPWLDRIETVADEVYAKHQAGKISGVGALNELAKKTLEKLRETGGTDHGLPADMTFEEYVLHALRVVYNLPPWGTAVTGLTAVGLVDEVREYFVLREKDYTMGVCLGEQGQFQPCPTQIRFGVPKIAVKPTEVINLKEWMNIVGSMGQTLSFPATLRFRDSSDLATVDELTGMFSLNGETNEVTVWVSDLASGVMGEVTLYPLLDNPLGVSGTITAATSSYYVDDGPGRRYWVLEIAPEVNLTCIHVDCASASDVLVEFFCTWYWAYPNGAPTFYRDSRRVTPSLKQGVTTALAPKYSLSSVSYIEQHCAEVSARYFYQGRPYTFQVPASFGMVESPAK